MIDDIKNEIKDLIIEKLDFDRRKREQIESFESGDYNRFFHALFGKDPIIKYKLTHSIFTSWGMSIYEQSCKIIAEKVGYKCDLQKKIYGELNNDVMLYISQLKGDNNRVPNKRKELQRINELSSLGRPNEHPDSTVDVWITKPSGEEVLMSGVITHVEEGSGITVEEASDMNKTYTTLDSITNDGTLKSKAVNNTPSTHSSLFYQIKYTHAVKDQGMKIAGIDFRVAPTNAKKVTDAGE